MVSSRRSILQLPRNELLTEQNSRQHAYQVGVPILAHPSSITSDASIFAVHRHLVIKPGGVSSRTKDLVLHAMRLGMRDACWGSRVRACIHLRCSCASYVRFILCLFPFILQTHYFPRIRVCGCALVAGCRPWRVLAPMLYSVVIRR
jgi:hypothetical protein